MKIQISGVFKEKGRDFPSAPVAKTHASNAGGLGFNPQSGNYPHKVTKSSYAKQRRSSTAKHTNKY